jgi:hypothetical protein
VTRPGRLPLGLLPASTRAERPATSIAGVTRALRVDMSTITGQPYTPQTVRLNVHVRSESVHHRAGIPTGKPTASAQVHGDHPKLP